MVRYSSSARYLWSIVHDELDDRSLLDGVDTDVVNEFGMEMVARFDAALAHLENMRLIAEQESP